MQKGSLIRSSRRQGPDVWEYRERSLLRTNEKAPQNRYRYTQDPQKQISSTEINHGFCGETSTLMIAEWGQSR